MALLDLFRSKVFHSNPRTRLNELKSISDVNQNIFATVVKKDTDSEVRHLAIQRLTDSEALEWAASHETHDENRKYAQKKLNDIAYRHARDSEDEVEALSWFAKVSQSKSFQDLAKNAKLSSIKIKAIEQNPKENFLADILLSETNLEVAKVAFAKIEKQTSYEKVFKKAKSIEIRQLAKKELKTVQTSTQTKNAQVELKDSTTSTEAQNKAKRKVILTKLEAFDQRSEVLTYKEEFEALVKEWDLLKADADSESKTLIESYYENFQTKIQAIKDEQAIQEAAINKKQTAISQANEILVSLNQYAELYAATDDSRDQFQQIQQSWNQWGQAHSEVKLSDELSQSIQTQFQKIRSIHQRLDSQALDADQRKERRIDLNEQMKKLASQETIQLSDASILRQIISDWNQLGPIPADEQEQFQEFEQLETQLESTIVELENEIKAKDQAQEDALKAIIKRTQDLEVGDPKLNQKIQELYQDWKSQVGVDKNGKYPKKFDHLYKEFKEAQAPFSEVRQWEQWHNEKIKVELVEKSKKLSEISDEKELYSEIRKLQDEWKASGPVPQNRHQELWELFKEAQDANFERCQGHLAQMEQERQANLELKKQLIEETKILINNSMDFKDKQEQIKQAQSRWKEIGTVPREESESIWQEFKTVVDQFYAKRKEHFKAQEVVRLDNLKLKENICIQAESMTHSEEWAETSKQLIQLQKQWKSIGPVPRKDSDVIWARFRTACDGFFERKKSHFNELDDARAENLTAKQAVITQLEEASSNVPENLFEVLSQARVAWTEAGPVPRKDSDSIWDKFNEAQDKLIDLGLKQIPSFAKQIQSDIEAKKKLLERAKTVAESTNWSGTSDVLKEMQQEWKELNRVGSLEAELWKDFREVCDSFFNRRSDQYEIMEQNRINNLQDKEILLKQAQDLASRPVSEEVQREIKLLRKQWKELGQVPKKDSDRIWKAFNEACDACFPESE